MGYRSCACRLSNAGGLGIVACGCSGAIIVKVHRRMNVLTRRLMVAHYTLLIHLLISCGCRCQAGVKVVWHGVAC